MPDLLKYRNFRKYLRDFYKSEAKRSGLTYASFSRLAGINSPNYLKLVIDGKRNLTSQNIFLFAKALKFDFFELDYFEALVRWNQAEQKEESSFYRKRVFDFLARNESKAKASKAMVESLEIPAVAMAAHGRTHEEAITFITNRLGLKKNTARSKLSLLEDEGCLRLNSDLHYEVAASYTSLFDAQKLNVKTSDHIRRRIQKNLEEFSKSYTGDLGKFIAHTMTGPADSQEDLKNELLDLLCKISNRNDQMGKAGLEDVYEIDIQIMPARF